MELTKRIALDVGPQCNLDCKFCYHRDSHKQKNPSTSKLKKRLEKAKFFGIESIEFTGGEPALREDIFELIKYAKKLSFIRLGIISNGIKFSNLDFTRRVKEAGIEEIKFSIHSHNPDIQDELTGKKGSFKEALQGIRNARKLGLTIKTNTVIGQFNYKDLPETARFLANIRPGRINFKIITPILNARKLKEDILAPYSKIAPFLHKALDLLIQKRFNVTVRYIPFCFMGGYERYLYNLNQVQYDPDEWDYVIKNKIEYGEIISALSLFIGLLVGFAKKKSTDDFLHTAVIQSKLLRFTTKARQCSTCKYDFICGGLWKSYAKLYGYSELKPSAGEKIKDQVYFLKD